MWISHPDPVDRRSDGDHRRAVATDLIPEDGASSSNVTVRARGCWRHRRARNRRRRRRDRNGRRLGWTARRRLLDRLVFRSDDEDRIRRVVVDDRGVGEDLVRGRDDDDGVLGCVALLAGRGEDPVDRAAVVRRHVDRDRVADLRTTVEDPERDVDGRVLAVEDADVGAEVLPVVALLRMEVSTVVAWASELGRPGMNMPTVGTGARSRRAGSSRRSRAAAAGMLELDAAGAVRRVELRHHDVVEGLRLRRQRERHRVGCGSKYATSQ